MASGKRMRGEPQRHPKATFDILMAKYKEGRTGVRGHENWTIRNLKPDSSISLSQASSSATESSSDKRSQTPPCQNSEAWDHCQQEYHLTPYFPVRPPMPRPWRPPPMMHPPCPPWVRWYGPWTPPPMHFHPERLRPTQGFVHGGYYAGDGRYGHIGHQQDKRVSEQENWIVRNTKLDHPIS
jgi:hypothetical protein